MYPVVLILMPIILIQDTTGIHLFDAMTFVPPWSNPDSGGHLPMMYAIVTMVIVKFKIGTLLLPRHNFVTAVY